MVSIERRALIGGVLAVFVLAVASACSSSNRGGGETPDADLPDADAPDAGPDGATVGDPALLWPGAYPWDDYYWNYRWVKGIAVNGSTVGLAVGGYCCDDPIYFNDDPLAGALSNSCACTALMTFPWDSPDQLNIGSYRYQEVLEGPPEEFNAEIFYPRSRAVVFPDGTGFFTADSAEFGLDIGVFPLYPPVLSRWSATAETTAGPAAFDSVYAFPFFGGAQPFWEPSGPYDGEGDLPIGVFWGPENAGPDYSQDVYFQVDRYGVDGVVDNLVLETYPADTVFPDDAPPDFDIDGAMANGMFLWGDMLTVVYVTGLGVFIGQATTAGEVTIPLQRTVPVPDGYSGFWDAAIQQIDDQITIVARGWEGEVAPQTTTVFSIVIDMDGNLVDGPTLVWERWSEDPAGGDFRDLAWSGQYLGYCFEGARFMALTRDGHPLGGPWVYGEGGENIEGEHLQGNCATAAIDEDTFAVAWSDRFGDESGIYYTTIDVTVAPE
jgi:hypothetical protein